MRSRGVRCVTAAIRRLAFLSVAAAVLTLVSLHAFDRGYGTVRDDGCPVAGCPDLAPALARLVEAQQALGMHCTGAPRLSDVVAVDDGRGGASLRSLADLVASSTGSTQRTAIYCR